MKTKQNKIIANFMNNENYQEMGDYITPNYSISWGLLMPVVEKIESLGYRVEISHNECLIESLKDLGNSKINSGIGEIESTKLKATYKAVIEFIKHQNENTINSATYFIVDEIQQTTSEIIETLSNRFSHLDNEQLERNIKKVLIEECLLIDFNINISLKQ